ncbi:hypothetical protein XW81_02230 [Buchnera aphidicola (Schlechtendalia chinensis)]|uniref:UPF0250 protein XW81_02230 n=1 Tax=Buchnera aphidicola subsp. Schlechtendalia chinensis TaxID=118110 RepID=A0A172WDY9_BUCSC|nr:DUF493 family protein YbeD [Buchnera aphidicola]ANF17196.1 hypothetical protein XW81_02230 [Buchnera aphidicola (Schlechtendalia chinensis)]
MKNKLEKMLKFPCLFTYKVIGLAQPELIDRIIKVIQCKLPGDYIPQIKSSNKGNYLSISITICANNFKQIESLYHELNNINIVRMVL